MAGSVRGSCSAGPVPCRGRSPTPRADRSGLCGPMRRSRPGSTRCGPPWIGTRSAAAAWPMSGSIPRSSSMARRTRAACARARLERLGWRPAPEVQPSVTRVVDLTADETALWSDLRSKWRQYVNRARTLGVTVEDVDADLDPSAFPTFHRIMTETSTRTRTPIRTEAAYRDIWDAFRPSGGARLLFARGADGEVGAVLLARPVRDPGRRAVRRDDRRGSGPTRELPPQVGGDPVEPGSGGDQLRHVGPRPSRDPPVQGGLRRARGPADRRLGPAAQRGRLADLPAGRGSTPDAAGPDRRRASGRDGAGPADPTARPPDDRDRAPTAAAAMSRAATRAARGRSPSESSGPIRPALGRSAGWSSGWRPRAASARSLRDGVGLGGDPVAVGERAVHGVTEDSRLVRPGDLFVAIPGEHADGHDHLVGAVAAGAVAAIVERAGTARGRAAARRRPEPGGPRRGGGLVVRRPEPRARRGRGHRDRRQDDDVVPGGGGARSRGPAGRSRRDGRDARRADARADAGPRDHARGDAPPGPAPGDGRRRAIGRRSSRRRRMGWPPSASPGSPTTPRSSPTSATSTSSSTERSRRTGRPSSACSSGSAPRPPKARRAGRVSPSSTRTIRPPTGSSPRDAPPGPGC